MRVSSVSLRLVLGMQSPQGKKLEVLRGESILQSANGALLQTHRKLASRKRIPKKALSLRDLGSILWVSGTVRISMNPSDRLRRLSLVWHQGLRQAEAMTAFGQAELDVLNFARSEMDALKDIDPTMFQRPHPGVRRVIDFKLRQKLSEAE